MHKTRFTFPDERQFPKGPCYIEAVGASDALVVEENTGKFHTLPLFTIQKYAQVTPGNAPVTKVATTRTLQEAFEHLRKRLENRLVSSSEDRDRFYAFGGIWVHRNSMFEAINVTDSVTSDIIHYEGVESLPNLFKALNVDYEEFINGTN